MRSVGGALFAFLNSGNEYPEEGKVRKVDESDRERIRFRVSQFSPNLDLVIQP